MQNSRLQKVKNTISNEKDPLEKNEAKGVYQYAIQNTATGTHITRVRNLPPNYVRNTMNKSSRVVKFGIKK